MNREKHIFVFILCMILACMVFSGCGDMEDILNAVPKDLSFEKEEEDTMASSLSDSFRENDEGLAVQDEEYSSEEVSFLMEEAGDYAYNSLSEAQQLWYQDMEALLGGLGKNCKLDKGGLEAGLNEENIDKIFQCVLYDHPELFYVEGYSYTKYSIGGKLLSIEFAGNYSMDLEQAKSCKAQIEAVADEMLSGIDNNASQYEKVKFVYDTIIQNTDYQLDSPDNQNIYSVFINHLSVCQGYAKATQYLLNRLGVEATLVMGTVETGEGHAWNLVNVDGNYYYVDTTWGDASYRMLDGSDSDFFMPTINYDYLNVTTEELLRTHTIGGEVPMPACISKEANYYVREGALFTDYHREQITDLFAGIVDGGKSHVTIKCADEACYEEIRSALVEKQEIFQFLKGVGSKVAFTQNDKQLSMTFWVTNE